MLLDAVSRGRIYQVKFLLESGTEGVNRTDENKQTALIKAIFLPDNMQRTRYKIIKILLEYGAQVNIADRNGRTALMWACIRGQEIVARKILDFSIVDIDLNASDRFGNTALFYAASVGQISTVNQLIKTLKRFGLSIDKKNAQGMTPTLEAAKHGHDECTKLLITEGQASQTTMDPETFLNAAEWNWAEQRSSTNLSKEMTAITPSSPVNEAQKIEKPIEKTSEPASNSTDIAERERQDFALESTDNDNKATLFYRQRERELKESKLKRRDETFVQTSQGSSKDRTLGKEKRIVVKRGEEETSVSLKGTVSLTRRKCEQMNKIKIPVLTAKSEICRLLGLYGVQHSDSYRQSFDPIMLPPSGYWPDPLAHLRDSASSVEDDEIDMNFLELIRPRGSGRRRSSTLPAQGVPEMGRRGSCRDPRRGSTMILGLPGMGKRTSITPSPTGSKSFLEAPSFSHRRSTLLANNDRRGSTLGPTDRRGSLMPKGAEQSKVAFSRRATSQLVPSLGHITEWV